MSFLSDLGSFISDAQQLGEELGGIKDDLTEQAVSAATQVSGQVDEVKQELLDAKDSVDATIQDSAESIRSSL